jgi:hypothetical protein
MTLRAIGSRPLKERMEALQALLHRDQENPFVGLSPIVIHESAYVVAAKALGVTLWPTTLDRLRRHACDVIDVKASDDGSPEAFERMALVMAIADAAMIEFALPARGRDDVETFDLLWKAFRRRYGPLKENPSGLRAYKLRKLTIANEAAAFLAENASEIAHTAIDLAASENPEGGA